VFGGDLTNPIKSVTDAIASGKAAAIALDTYFTSGWHEIESRLNASRVADGPALSMETYLNKHRQSRNRHVVSFSEINTDYFEPEPRNEPPEADLNFTEPFAETIGTFSESNAMKESSRCFNCGICNDCDNCRVFCPELAVTVDHSREINLDYCKGCGICAVECPRNAISLKGEKP
jgi:Pyruvate/2-oxoacid:ferredoxin oxidoreductase delta subunit